MKRGRIAMNSRRAARMDGARCVMNNARPARRSAHPARANTASAAKSADEVHQAPGANRPRTAPPASSAHPPPRARKTLLYNADDIARQHYP
jgi:hypothetical protein